MSVNWSKDIDQTLAAAKEQSRPILLDFSAADPVQNPALAWANMLRNAVDELAFS